MGHGSTLEDRLRGIPVLDRPLQEMLRYIKISIYLSIYPSIHPSIHLSIYLSIPMYVCMHAFMNVSLMIINFDHFRGKCIEHQVTSTRTKATLVFFTGSAAKDNLPHLDPLVHLQADIVQRRRTTKSLRPSQLVGLGENWSNHHQYASST